MNKNLWLLILSQVFAFTAAPVTVFLSGIIGSQFSPSKIFSNSADGFINCRYSNFCNLCCKGYEHNRPKSRIYVCISWKLTILITCCIFNSCMKVLFLFNFACFLLRSSVLLLVTSIVLRLLKR